MADNKGVWFIGVCTECHSDQPANYMEKTKFMEPPCKFCGGVVNIIRYTTREDRDAYLARKDAERGIFTAPARSEEKESVIDELMDPEVNPARRS